jgi:hypothetical protein
MKMKAILFALALTAASAFGQGVVSFQNSTLNGTGVRLPASEGGAFITGNNTFSFYFTYGTSSGALTQTSATFSNNSSSAGRIAGSTYIALTGIDSGTTAFFQMYAFSTAHGNYATASTTPGAYYYQSQIISAPAGNPLNAAGTPLFGSNPASTFQGFNLLTPVPEPSTIALGALGIGSLLFIRRRK